jgi:translocator protein
MMRNPWVMLVFHVSVCLVVGVLAGITTAHSVTTWYPSLVKPTWNPPSWVFAPVWTTLYVMMGVAAWLVWRRGTDIVGVRVALSVFWVQLFFNLAWSFLFFGARSPMLALADVVLLWLALALCVRNFFRVAKEPGLLMLPYLAWVSFAACLNFAIWRLN